MRRGGAGLLVAVLALAGCKSADKSAAKNDKTPGSAASRGKGKGPSWLDELDKTPIAGTEVPKGGPADPTVAGRGTLGGKVLDPTGRGVEAYIRIEPTDTHADDKKLAPVGIMTNKDGYFQTGGLKPGLAYTLTAEVKQDGKSLVAIAQTRPPNTTLALQLRDDVALPGPLVPPVGPGGGELPPPAPTETIPPVSTVPPAPPQRPADGSFSPGAVPVTKPGLPPPLSVNPPSNPTPTPTPTPTAVPPPVGVRPEDTATRPRDQGFPPPASIPNPPVPGLSNPPVPTLPPAPGQPTGRPRSSRPAGPVIGTFTLLDTLEREWDLASSRSGPLVLVEFMTTTCVPCKKALPVLTDMQAKYGAAGLQVLGVVCDGGPVIRRVELAKKYQSANGLNYSLYVEPGSEAGAVRDRLHVEAYPTAVLIDASGREVWRGHPAKRDELEQAVRENLGR